jgi:hypothetical protein
MAALIIDRRLCHIRYIVETADKIPVTQAAQGNGLGLVGKQLVNDIVRILSGNLRCKVEHCVGAVNYIIECLIVAIGICMQKVLTAYLTDIVRCTVTLYYII